MTDPKPFKACRTCHEMKPTSAFFRLPRSRTSGTCTDCFRRRHNMEGEYRCSKCKMVKPLTEFYRNKAHLLGHQNNCKACQKENVGNWQRRNKDKTVIYAKRSRDKDLEKDKDDQLRRKLGIKNGAYAAMLENQGGGCAVCGTPPSEGKRLHVDHCHATGNVRGILCWSCNSAIGHFKDDPVLLQKAILYLTRR